MHHKKKERHRKKKEFLSLSFFLSSRFSLSPSNQTIMGKEVDDAMDVEKTTTSGDDDKKTKDKKGDDEKKKASSTTTPSPPPPVRDLLLQAAAALDKAAAVRDVRALPARALRLFAAARARVTGADVLAFAREVLPGSSSSTSPSTTTTGSDGDVLAEIEGALKQVRVVFCVCFVRALRSERDREWRRGARRRRKGRKRGLRGGRESDDDDCSFFFSIARIGRSNRSPLKGQHHLFFFLFFFSLTHFRNSKTSKSC